MLAPTLTAHLYQGLHEQLMTLLRGIVPDAWNRPEESGGTLAARRDLPRSCGL
jgi:hypothetical protein